jgi:solute carrier family 8 (sodium/calcium exchanger)
LVHFSGWVTFFVAIFAIGVLTALIGDVAAMFGCTIGLKDIVTAITCL